MKSLKLIGLALARHWRCRRRRCAGHHRRGRGPDVGRRIRVRPADEERRRTAVVISTRRRRARQEIGARRRGRRLRSQAGALVAEKIASAKILSSPAIIVLVVDPGVGSLRRWQRAADHAGLRTNPLYTERKLWKSPRLRPRRSAGLVAANTSRRITREERRHPQRQDTYGKASPTRQEGAQQGRLQERC